MSDLQMIRDTLNQVMAPELNRSIVELGMVHDLRLADAIVRFTFGTGNLRFERRFIILKRLFVRMKTCSRW